MIKNARPYLFWIGIFCIAPTVAAEPPPKLPLEDLQRFTTVVEHIHHYYVQPNNDSALFENAIRGMLEGLDPHSSFLTPADFAELKAATSGKFGGLGLEVTLSDGFIQVISPIDNTPAAKAGVKSGDLIIRIDDTPVKGISLKKSVELMRGERGTPVLLTIIREGETAPLQIKVRRDFINVESVRSRLLAENFGYIRISQFQDKTGKDLQKALQTLVKDNTRPLQGLVMDLRNNPGGIFEAAVDVADTFLDAQKLGDKKLIVYTEGRLPGSEMKAYAHNGDKLQGAPIIVLINGGSASASEIVAGALQDYKRALIVGTQSFGKGSVQTIFPLDKDYGLKITTALYYTPLGRSIQARGIVPDIFVEDAPIPPALNQGASWASLRESDLQGHLNNTRSAETNAPTPTFEAINDYPLQEALHLLKGIAALKPA